MRPRLSLPAGLILLNALPSLGLDISGRVLDKAEQPIPQALICLKNNPSRCVNTSENGTFRILDSSGVGIAPKKAGPILAMLGDRITLTVPSALIARLSWHDAAGRASAPTRVLGLAAGVNSVSLPDRPRDGLHFLRLTADGLNLAWKAVLAGGSLEKGTGRRAMRLLALSKASAALTDLVITKAGYRPQTYRPAAEVETDAVVVLTALSDSGLVFSSSFKARNALDRANGTWITETDVDTCSGTTPVRITVKDTARFAVRDGKLWHWDEGRCVGEVLTGTSADVAGAWTLAESDVFLPQDLRPASCQDTLRSRPVPPTVQSKLTITEADQTFDITAEICPPDLYLGLIAFYLISDSTVELSRNTCRQLQFRNGAGEEATISFAKRGDSLASTFTHMATVCAAVEMMREGEGVVPDCASEDPVLPFLECMAATGFFGDPHPMPRAKAAAPRFRPAALVPRPAFRGSLGRYSAPSPASAWKRPSPSPSP